jgi:two-component system cell cycle sensor histidine kinase/response regulator CckA
MKPKELLKKDEAEATVKLKGLTEQLQLQLEEHKKAEQMLLNAAQQWRTIFDAIGDMVCLLDPQGKILRCNKAMANFLRKPFPEIINHTYSEIMQCATPFIENCPFTRMKETRQRETVISQMHGRWFDVAVDPLLDEEGSLLGAVQTMSDITKRKQAEEALRSSEEKYRAILENLEDGYYEVDVAGNFTFFNDPECRILGYSREELIGVNNRDYTDPETAKKVYEVFNKVYKTGEPVKRFEFEVIRKDRTRGFIEISVSLIRDAKGEGAGFRGIARDITERKREEEERNALQEQLSQFQKMETIGQLAGGVAHDFNNLLTVITGYTDLLLNSIKPNNPLYPDTIEIKKASEKAESLTRQLLAFSRKQALQPKVLDLNGLVSNMDKMLRRLIGENIQLVTVLTEDLGKIKADPGQIEQVIVNLAVNARDAMSDGGKLTIETANVKLDEQYTRTHISVIPGLYVMFSLSDTGTGITEEIKERIFEPFFTTKEKGKGTGLGLSTVYGIVKQSGGNISVYSEPGHGTTFKIYLPRADEDVESLKPTEVSTESFQGSETILLVEDEEVVQRVTAVILQNGGYTVLEATDGEEALRLVQEHNGNPIDLVVTDVVMPRISGVRLAKYLFALCPKIKVLYMSGYMDNALIQQEILKPGMPYIQKPFTPEDLARKVREVLDGHS